jgi:hypothetical protein
MSRARVAVLQVVSKQLSVTEAAAEYGRSRRPKTHPAATTEQVRARVIELRGELVRSGSDAGPVTIAWHLEHEGLKHLHRAVRRRSQRL